ncbi:MAG: hypothetical protein QOE35_2321 [Actinomycetota bacterium]|jgi:hypothetical protein
MRRLSLRRPAPASIVTFLVVAGAVVFVLAQLSPSLLTLNTTPAGGDMGAHVATPAYLRDHLLPHWRLTGWSPDWYAGTPILFFYFPLPMLAIVLLDVVLPYGVAFKLISVSGLVALPVAAWAFGKLAGMRRPGPACLAAATVPYLFNRGYTIYGGNVPSTLAGEFTFSIGLALAIVFLGVLANGLRTGRHRALAALLLAATGLCHVLPAYFAVAGAIVLTLMEPSVRRLKYAIPVGIVGGAVSAFWVVPFIMRLPFTTDMGWEKLTTFHHELLPQDLRWVVVLAAGGGAASVLLRRRVGTFLTIMATLSALAFRFLPQGRIWNARMLPFWFLCLFLLAGVAVAEAGRGVAWLLERRPSMARVAESAAAVVAITGALIFTAFPLQVLPGGRHLADGSYQWLTFKSTDKSFIPGWVNWNYTGYERKSGYPEYRDILTTMGKVGERYGCGRANWEYESELDQQGTPMSLMLLPYWTKGCIGSMEGVYFESAASTPYHFLMQSELSKRPSRPQRDLPYRDLDVTQGVEHLQLMGVKYYMVFSDDAKAQARANPELQLVDTIGPWPVNYTENNQSVSRDRNWEVYEVSGSATVAPLDYLPAVMTDLGAGAKTWQAAGVDFFQHPDRWDVPRAASGPSNWPRVRAGTATAPRRPVEPASVSRIKITDDRISFDVDRVGVPVLVKSSYFPNWHASGAKGPWRVTPNQMVVVPTKKHVELHFGYTGVDIMGDGLTALGLAAVVAFMVADHRRRRREASTVASGEAERELATSRNGDGPDDDLDGAPLPREEPVAVPTSSDP